MGMIIRELNAAEETPTEDASDFDIPKNPGHDDPFDEEEMPANLPKNIFDDDFANIEKSYLSRIPGP